VNELLRAEVLTRAGGRCEGCGAPLHTRAEVHHRQAKGMGGPGIKGLRDYPGNLLVLHPKCHRWAHAHPRHARMVGWVVPSWSDPTATPVTRYVP
jgi:hypothetical protein